MAVQQSCFWLVWALDGPTSKYKHSNQQSAENEAVRLARENPGTQFVVMQSLTGHHQPLPGVEKIDFDPIPF